jgi:uncharacterized protein YkwD
MIARGLAAVLLLALAACATTDVTPTATSAIDWINQYRAAHGLGRVATDARLTAFARAQAERMAASGDLSHSEGGSFASRVKAAGLDDAARIAENIAYGNDTERATMEQWKVSSGHRANLLMARATRFGIASARSGGARPTTYWAMAIAADPEPPVPVLGAAGPASIRTTAPAAPPFGGLFGR